MKTCVSSDYRRSEQMSQASSAEYWVDLELPPILHEIVEGRTEEQLFRAHEEIVNG